MCGGPAFRDNGDRWDSSAVRAGHVEGRSGQTEGKGEVHRYKVEVTRATCERSVSCRPVHRRRQSGGTSIGFSATVTRSRDLTTSMSWARGLTTSPDCMPSSPDLVLFGRKRTNPASRTRGRSWCTSDRCVSASEHMHEQTWSEHQLILRTAVISRQSGPQACEQDPRWPDVYPWCLEASRRVEIE